MTVPSKELLNKIFRGSNQEIVEKLADASTEPLVHALQSAGLTFDPNERIVGNYNEQTKRGSFVFNKSYVDFDQRYLREKRWDVLMRVLEVLENSVKKKNGVIMKEEDGYSWYERLLDENLIINNL